jgi:hypothetical protein
VQVAVGTVLTLQAEKRMEGREGTREGRRERGNAGGREGERKRFSRRLCIQSQAPLPQLAMLIRFGPGNRRSSPTPFTCSFFADIMESTGKTMHSFPPDMPQHPWRTGHQETKAKMRHT